MHLDLDCITFGIVEQSVEKSHGGAAMYVKLPKKVDLAISNVFGMIQLNIFFFFRSLKILSENCAIFKKVINGGHDQKVIFD